MQDRRRRVRGRSFVRPLAEWSIAPFPPPRSSNRTCGSPASGSQTGFTWRHAARCTSASTHSFHRSSSRLLEASGSSPQPRSSTPREAHLNQGPSLHGRYPLHRYYEPLRLLTHHARGVLFHRVRSPTLRTSPLSTCRAHYPGGLPDLHWTVAPVRRCGLPLVSAGSAPTSVLSRPAQASLALRPADLLDLLRGLLRRGFTAGGRPPSVPDCYPGWTDSSSGGTFTRW